MATNNKTTVAEAEILSSFLLSRAALRDIITPRGFADLFPKDKRSNPQVRILYRELQQARTRQCDRVQRSIQQEARQGAMYRKQAAEKRKKDESLDEDVMLGIEVSIEPLQGLSLF